MQLESMSSGGVVDVEEWIRDEDDIVGALAIQTFSPDKECLRRIATTCPRIARLDLLIRDQDLQMLAEGLEDLPSW